MDISKYPEEFIRPLLICFDLLYRCNIGVFDKNKKFLARQCRTFVIAPFVLVHLTSMSFYMRTLFSKQIKISKLAFMVSAYMVSIQAILKAAFIIPYVKDIEKLVDSIGASWNNDKITNEQAEKRGAFMKRLNIVHRVFYWGSIIATWQNMMTPLFSTMLQRFQGKNELQLPFEYVLPFDVDTWFKYTLVYIFQWYTMFRLVYVYIGTELLKIILCAFLGTKFMLLREQLKYITPACDSDEFIVKVSRDENAYLMIKTFIKEHQGLLQLSELLNSIFNRMVFVDLLFATITACFFSFAATVSHNAADIACNLFAVLVVMTPIYVYCYYSTILEEESTGIANAAYENRWYQGNIRYQETINYIIARSQKPCYLMALKHTPLTLHTFTTVLSTTWSYFSLARSVYTE